MTTTPPLRSRSRLRTASSWSAVAMATVLTVSACAGQAPSPSPSPEPTPTATPAPTPTPSPTPAPTPTPSPSPSPTPEPTPTPTPSPTPEPTPTPSPTPEPTPSPTPSPSPPAEVAGYAIDPATGLPIVPEGEGGPWWWDGPPELPLDPALRYSSEAPAASALDPDQRRLSLLAQYPSHAEALAVAEALAGAIGDPEAEVEWLTEAGYDGFGFFDWLGSEASITPFVQVVDRWLIVSELAYLAEQDPGAKLSEGPRHHSPLALALAETAEMVIVEDAWSEDKGVAFDLVCRGDPDALVTLSQDLADNAELYDMQPLWLEPSITADQRRARRTLRLLNTLDAESFESIVDTVRYVELAGALEQAGTGGTAATQEAREDLTIFVEDWVLAHRPDLEPLGELLDPGVFEAAAQEFAHRVAAGVLAGQETRPPTVASGQFAAAPYGAHQAPLPWIMGEAVTYAGLDGDQLWLSLGLFHGVAAGLGPMVDYLTQNGCGDIKVAFTDYGYGISLRQGE